MDNSIKSCIESIQIAFKDVRLEDGIGLWEAQGLDDYASEETIAEYRARDERHDWQRLPYSELNRCYSSLSFFDAKGMRFHLPAFLLADLEGFFTQDVLFYLCSSDEHVQSFFSLFNATQREAVRQYLSLQAADPMREPLHQSIRNALNGYWSVSKDIHR